MSLDKLSGFSVVIPAFNEGGAIAETLTALSQTLSRLGRPFEIIVVDDGSTDDTASHVKSTGVRLIQHPANSGYGKSLLTGIEASAHDTIAILDADGTYPIEQLPELLALFDKGFDMVVGARQGRFYGKRMLRLFFRLLAEYSCGRSIPDINSGFRVFTKKPVLTWQSSVSTGFSFTTTITLLYMLNRLQVAYTPVTYNKRTGKSKVRLFSDSLRSLQIMFTAIAQFNPLKLYLLILGAAAVGTGGLIAAGQRWPFIAFGLLIGWNTLCLLMGMAVLAVAATKPAPTLLSGSNNP